MIVGIPCPSTVLRPVRPQSLIHDAFGALAWLIWPTDGLDELLEAGAFRILSVESEAVAESIDQGKAIWTVTVKLTDVDQLRHLAVRANPREAGLIADSLAVAWQSAADPFAPLQSIPGIHWRPGQVVAENLAVRAHKPLMPGRDLRVVCSIRGFRSCVGGMLWPRPTEANTPSDTRRGRGEMA